MYSSIIFAQRKIAFCIQIWFQVDVKIEFVSVYAIKKKTEAAIVANVEIVIDVKVKVK